MENKSEALRYIHGEPGERFFHSELMTDVTEGAMESHYVQYNAMAGMADIQVVLLLNEGDKYTVAVFTESSSDPDDFNTTLTEESEESFDFLPDAITSFGQQAMIAATQDNDESLSRMEAIRKLTMLRQRFGITPPPMKF